MSKQNKIYLLSVSIILAGLAVYFFQTRPSAYFITENISSPAIALEVVDDAVERERGLMFRQEFKGSQGMLFVFPEEKVQSFWMKNTYVSLDILFIDSSFKVVGILENVPPLNEQPRGVEAASRYVLELPAGSSKVFGIKKGSVFKSNLNLR